MDLGIGSLTTSLETKPIVWEGYIIAAALSTGVVCPPGFLLPAICSVIRAGGVLFQKGMKIP